MAGWSFLLCKLDAECRPFESTDFFGTVAKPISPNATLPQPANNLTEVSDDEPARTEENPPSETEIRYDRQLSGLIDHAGEMRQHSQLAGSERRSAKSSYLFSDEGKMYNLLHSPQDKVRVRARRRKRNIPPKVLGT